MKRTLKIGVAVVLALIALVLAAAVALPYVVDTAAYREDLERVVEQRTGRTLTIEGRTRLSVLPWLGLEVGKVTLGNAPGFGPKPFARVAAADVRVRVLPLLWGEVVIGTVRLRAPEVNLARDASGRTNWADLAPPAAEAPSGDTGAAEPASGGQGGPGVLAALSLGGLEVRDGHVSWTDAVTGVRYAASAVDLTSGAVRMGEPFPIDLAFDVASKEPALSGRVQVRGQAMADVGAQRYALRGLALDTRLQGAALPTDRLEASLAADLTADWAAGTAALTDGELHALGGRVTAEVDLTGLHGVPALSGQVKLEGDDGERLAALLGALVPALQWQPAALAGSYAKARFDGDLGAEGLRVTDLEGSLLGLHLDGRAGLRRLDAAPRLDLDLRGEVTDGRRLLSPLADALPVDLRPAALDGARLRAEAAMDTATGRLNLPAVTLESLGATLRANAAVEGLNAAVPTASGRVELAPFSPRRALERLGMPLPAAADPKAFSEAAFAAAFAAGPDHLRLEGIEATLDQSRLTGSLAVPSFAGPVLRFDLALNGMDVDRYLPPAAEGEAGDSAPATPAEAAGGGAMQLPMSLLRQVDVSGEVTAGRLQIQGLRLSDLEARLDGREGQLRLHPLTARLYGGQYAGDVRLDARGEAPRVRLSERLSGVATGP
ncbi:MAG TPA: AsmA family protein, partial [Gammaproteobacteria bacterium]|nr:AsmA family protein [Gammaproteobacteria bacterium]